MRLQITSLGVLSSVRIDQPFQFAWHCPSSCTESPMPWEFPQSQADWDSWSPYSGQTRLVGHPTCKVLGILEMSRTVLYGWGGCALHHCSIKQWQLCMRPLARIRICLALGRAHPSPGQHTSTHLGFSIPSSEKDSETKEEQACNLLSES